MTNLAIAEALRNLADLLEGQGDSEFRVRGLRFGADVIAVLDFSIAEHPDWLRVRTYGIGKGIERRVYELLRTGKLAEMEELREEQGE